jgi:integrase
MAGQLIQRGERTWLVRVYTGTDPQTAKRSYLSKTIHGNKKEAQQYLNRVLHDRDAGIVTAGMGNKIVTVGMLLDDLLRDYEINEQCVDWAQDLVRVHLRPFFGALKAGQVGTDQINSYVTSRKKPATRRMVDGKERHYPPAQNATINNELSLLRRAYNLAKNSDPPKVARVPHIPKLAVSNVRTGFFEHEPFINVRRALPEEIQPVITFAYYTGCRKGEILKLRWPQFDIEERVVRLAPGETKNDEPRTIPLVPELYEMLMLQKAMRDKYWPHSPWIFSRLGKPIKDFRNAWLKACKAAGLGGDEDKARSLFHDLRRTGVRNLIRAGVPEKVAMMISGHKTRSIFDRYNIVDERDLKDAARRLGEYLAHKNTPVSPHITGTQKPTNSLQ